MEHYLQFPLCFYSKFFWTSSGRFQWEAVISLPDDSLALREEVCSPVSQKTFWEHYSQSNRTRSHSLAANVGVSPPALHLRILRHWHMVSWALLATMLGTDATTGGIRINTKTGPYTLSVPRKRKSLMLPDASPGVRDDCDDSLVKLLFFYSAPVHEDTHALRLHSGHDVKLVSIERKSHHWHTVINCLKYTIHPTVADKSFHIGVPCRERNGSKSMPSMLQQGYRGVPQHTMLMYV